MSMITIQPSKSFLEPPEEDNEGGQTEADDETVETAQAPLIVIFESFIKPFQNDETVESIHWFLVVSNVFHGSSWIRSFNFSMIFFNGFIKG